MKGREPMKHTQGASANDYPTARKIRRDCSKEIYRALKRMNVHVEQSKLTEAEQYYTKMVITHFQVIRELSKNRKNQVQWWDEHCSEQLSVILGVDRTAFVEAFTKAYLIHHN